MTDSKLSPKGALAFLVIFGLLAVVFLGYLGALIAAWWILAGVIYLSGGVRVSGGGLVAGLVLGPIGAFIWLSHDRPK